MASSAPPPPPQFPLPAVHTALSPYIHPPQETLHIRQLATQHLTNLSAEKRITDGSGSTDEFRRFLDFELGRKGPDSSVRKEYLIALRENLQAKREYEDILREGDDDSPGDEGGVKVLEEEEEEGWRELYLNTLKLRRQHERLELLRVYLNTVSNPTAEDLAAEAAESFNEQPPAPPIQLTAQRGTGIGSDSEEIKAGVEAMILRLEKEVVAAYEALEQEKNRIQDLQEGLHDDPQGTKKEALMRARDTLISWLEGQLARTTAGGEPEDADMMDATSEEQAEGGSSAQQIVDRIQAAYNNYLRSRTELVHILASASSIDEIGPLSIDPTDPPTELPGTMKKPIPAPPILSVLTAMEHLLPLTKYAKSLLYQRTQLSTSLSAQQKQLLRLLESSLEKFSIQPPPIAATTVSPSLEMVTALASASKAAIAKNCIEVGKNVTEAKKTLENVESVLAEVEALVIMPKKEVSKIPMARRKKKGRREEEEEADKGLWGGLGGGVGVIGDGI
ncbi:uncharacterized protein LAJ45_06278 [Morchella importuna]|uniref:uncharacterized protein n=1 Tax=Morchella importuna TaxID=1174673 RepID=UPI001E8D397C|nr:uncharacterized protein LAJ45_06278 [Morchella importuna]KAH8149647.1 hypothetical protein LAJ45_06278 [Morchella importuna]